jgi:hypothetical protein
MIFYCIHSVLPVSRYVLETVGISGYATPSELRIFPCKAGYRQMNVCYFSFVPVGASVVIGRKKKRTGEEYEIWSISLVC